MQLPLSSFAPLPSPAPSPIQSRHPATTKRGVWSWQRDMCSTSSVGGSLSGNPGESGHARWVPRDRGGRQVGPRKWKQISGGSRRRGLPSERIRPRRATDRWPALPLDCMAKKGLLAPLPGGVSQAQVVWYGRDWNPLLLNAWPLTPNQGDFQYAGLA